MFSKFKKYLAKKSYQNRLECVALEIIKSGKATTSDATKYAVCIIDDVDRIVSVKFDEIKPGDYKFEQAKKGRK